MQQRIFSRVLSSLWLMLLVACQSAPASSAPTIAAPPTSAASATTTVSTVVPTAAPTPAPQPSAPPAPTAQPDTLTLWAVATDTQSDTVRRLIGDVAQIAGVNVSVAIKSADGLYTDVKANILVGLPPPDLVYGTQEDLGLLYRDGLLQPADDGQRDDSFLPATVASATVAGQRWGTPIAATDALLLLYNRKLVSTPPTTTDALIASARAQKRGDKAGIVAGWAEPRWLAAWLNGMGGALTDANDAPTLDTPQMVSALDLLKELRASGPPAPSTYNDGVRAFISDNAAFSIDGTWALANYRAYSDTLDLGIAPMPVVPSTGRIAAPPLNGVYLLYGKGVSGERLAQAKKLGVVFLQPSVQARIAHDLGALPALQAALNEPAVRDDPALAAAAAQVAGAPGLPVTPGLRCAWEAVRVALPPVLLGDLTPPDAVKQMQERALACVHP